MLTLNPECPNTDMINYLTTALWSNNRQVAATIAKESLACGDTDSFNQLHYEASLAVIYVIVVVYSSGWKVIMRIT